MQYRAFYLESSWIYFYSMKKILSSGKRGVAGMSRIWGVAEYRALRGMETGGRVGDAAFGSGQMVIAPP
jgi:hypothetical protein